MSFKHMIYQNGITLISEMVSIPTVWYFSLFHFICEKEILSKTKTKFFSKSNNHSNNTLFGTIRKL